jgi:hypothetical protein
VKVDINAAIEAYSHAGGNRIERLRAICADSVETETTESEIRTLQEGILEQVREQAGADGLTREHIEQIARQFLAVRPEVNEDGLDGLLRYVIWIAWHDGWLQLHRRTTG